MARISFVEGGQLEDALDRSVGREAADTMSYAVRIWAHRPDLLAAVMDFQTALKRQSTLGARLIELVRLRVAYHNQCRTCMARRLPDGVADGVTEALVCELASPQDSQTLTERERAALAYADLLASDHLSIDDETFTHLRRHFDEAEIVELGAHIAWCIGIGRLTHSWDVVDDLPDEYHASGAVLAPWTVPPVGAGQRA
jgi:alkylhydroperoxidase family enzyme